MSWTHLQTTQEFTRHGIKYDYEPVRSYVEAQHITNGPWAPRLDFTEAIRKFIV